MTPFWGVQPRDVGDLPDAMKAQLREMGPDAYVASLGRFIANREAGFGPNHPELAVNLYHFARLLDALSRYEEAEPLFRRSLAIYEATRGPSHYEAATVLNSLATLLETVSRYEEAEPLYRRSLAINEAAFGPSHLSVGVCLHNLAGLLVTLDRYEEAEPLYRRSLAISKAAYGPFHPDFVLTWISLNLTAIKRGLARVRRSRVEQTVRAGSGAPNRQSEPASLGAEQTAGPVVGGGQGEPIVLSARPYTVEPGFPECANTLAEHKGGGLGSVQPSTRYFSFFDNAISPLSEFLETMTRAGNHGDHVSYCTDSVEEVGAYLGKYLSAFLSAAPDGDRVIGEIQEHLRGFPMRREYFEREKYRENMVMHTRFFQDFYYDIAHVVAGQLMPDELLESCFSAFGLPPRWTAGAPGTGDEFVERLSSNPKYRFYTDAPDSSFRAVFGANRMDDFHSGPAFYCSLHDYENYIKPYIFFLSTWSLLLGVYLSMRVFGQCAFVVCWETTNGVDPNILRGR